MAPTIHPSIDPSRARPTTGAIGLSSLARAVRRYSLLMFVFVLLSAAAGALVYFFLPLPKMTGRVVYLVNTNPGGTLNPNYWNDRDPANYRALQANTLVRREVLNAALSEPGVIGLPMFHKDESIDPIQYLQTHLKIDFTAGAEHMRVTLEGDTEEELRMVLKAIDSAYMKVVYDKDVLSRKAKLNNLQKLQSEQSALIKNIRQQIRQILTVGNLDPDMEDFRSRHVSSMLATVDSEVVRLNTTEYDLAMALKHMEGQLKLPVALREPPSEELILNFVETDERVRDLARSYESLSMQIDALSKPLLPSAPRPAQLVELENKRNETKTKLDGMRRDLKVAYAQRLKEEMAKKEKDILESLKKRLDLVKERKQALTKQIEQFINELGQIKNQAATADDLRVELKNAESIVSKINAELVTIKTEMDAPQRVLRWEDPYVMNGIEGNRRRNYTLMAIGAFLAMGLGLTQWLELRNRRIQSLDELTGGLGLPVLGTVPAMPKGGVTSRSNWPHLLTEAVNTTRTMLLSGPRAAETKTLLVTSAMSGEGKTSLTTHLAVSLAGAGRRVLLIDADMRRPAVHKVLGVDSKPGLAEMLVGASTLADVTVTTKVPGLSLVPAGTYSREAALSLSTERWPSVLCEAATGYDFVLVDSPPILPVADALAIAKNVDGVLISVMQDLSRYGAVQTACQRLSMVGAKVLGVVVSGVKTTGGYYYYYYDERYSSPKDAAAPEAANVQPTETA